MADIWEVARFAGDGYDRADVADKVGWRVVASWGRKGWDLGEWPYVMVYFREIDGRYEVCTNVEGDADVQTFDTLEARNAAVDTIAAYYWKHNGNGPSAEEVATGDHVGPMRPETW